MADSKQGVRTPPNAGKGRPKGTPNKTTAQVKEALSLAFKGIGGVPALERWARKEENRAAFYGLWVKMLPHEVTGPDGSALGIRVIFEDLKPG